MLILCGGLRRAASSLRLLARWLPQAPTRAVTTHPQKFLESEERWRRRDDVPLGWELIYKGPMDNVINPFSTFVTVSTAVIAGVGVYSYFFVPHDPEAPILLGTSDVVIADNFKEFIIYIAAFIVLHIIVRVFISRFVIRLYKNEDRYLAVFRGHLYNQIIKHEFHVKEFEKLEPTSFVAWGESRYALGSRKGILLEDYFKTPRHLRVMLYHKDTSE